MKASLRKESKNGPLMQPSAVAFSGLSPPVVKIRNYSSGYIVECKLLRMLQSHRLLPSLLSMLKIDKTQKFYMHLSEILEGKEGQVIRAAKYNNDLRRLLRPWCTFRLYVKFLKPNWGKEGEKLDSTHYYGYEHGNITYNQCFHGHVTEIPLNKLHGFLNCVQMAEERFNGKYSSAVIYQRVEFPHGKFLIECRKYNKAGEPFFQQDPVITDDWNRTMYHSKVGAFLYVTEEPVDFKKEVANALETSNS